MAGLSQTSSFNDNLSQPVSLLRSAPSSGSNRTGGKTAVTEEETNLALESFLNSLQMPVFFRLTEEEQDERLSKIDAVDLFNALKEVNRDLAFSRLENIYLIDFLQKNDPKLLIGLQQRRATAQGQIITQQLRGKSAAASVASSGGAARSRSQQAATASTYTTASTKKSQADYRLNFRAKTDMAEKTATDVEMRVREIENTASREIKILRGRMEEMRYMYEETQETATNFKLHFLRDEFDEHFLNTATEKQLERKVRKFINNWIKNARALLATVRLKITALQENCQQLRSELLTKADLSGILTAVDFEKLVLKRGELMNSLEERNFHMTGMKGVTGKASLSMTEEKQNMMAIEEESKKLNNKTVDVVKVIAKLEREARIVEGENQADVQALENLKVQSSQYEAPSVNQYIDKKDEVVALEKEEKMLRRKVYIMKMKLENMQKKCKYSGAKGHKTHE